MATRAAQGGALTLPAIIAAIARLDRDSVAEIAMRAVDRLDTLEPDEGDLEPNGDELDFNAAEDDFCDHNADGPGCPIGDPGEDDDDDHGEEERGEQGAWLERIDQTAAPYPFETPADYRNGEDAEPDDPCGDPLDAGELDYSDSGYVVPFGIDQTRLPPGAPNGWHI